MQRWLTRILACLILGAVTTVGVAWGLVWYVDLTWMEPQSAVFMLPDSQARTKRIDLQMFLIERGAFRVAWVEGVEASEMIFDTYIDTPFESRSRPLESPDARDITWCFRGDMPIDPIMHVSDARGWPMLALCGGLDLRPSGGGCRDISHTYWTLAVMQPDPMRWLYPSVDYKRRLIPAMPVWPGFLIDTLFYGAPWLGIIVGFGAARRGLRKQRGRCPICAYDLRGNLETGCPECGWNREAAHG